MCVPFARILRLTLEEIEKDDEDEDVEKDEDDNYNTSDGRLIIYANCSPHEMRTYYCLLIHTSPKVRTGGHRGADGGGGGGGEAASDGNAGHGTNLGKLPFCTYSTFGLGVVSECSHKYCTHP